MDKRVYNLEVQAADPTDGIVLQPDIQGSYENIAVGEDSLTADHDDIGADGPTVAMDDSMVTYENNSDSAMVVEAVKNNSDSQGENCSVGSVSDSTLQESGNVSGKDSVSGEDSAVAEESLQADQSIVAPEELSTARGTAAGEDGKEERYGAFPGFTKVPRDCAGVLYCGKIISAGGGG
jgi:hypothetical protein